DSARGWTVPAVLMPLREDIPVRLRSKRLECEERLPGEPAFLALRSSPPQVVDQRLASLAVRLPRPVHVVRLCVEHAHEAIAAVAPSDCGALGRVGLHGRELRE